MLPVPRLDKHVAQAFGRDRLDKDFISGTLGGAASLDYEASFAGGCIIKIAAYNFLDRIRKPNHGGDALGCLDFSDSIGTQSKRGDR
jgi:hypothetical protein